MTRTSFSVVTDSPARTLPWLVACACACALACGSGTGDQTQLTESLPVATESSASTAATGTTAAVEDTGDTHAVLYDVGRIPDMPIFDTGGCRAIDFLFVIDNSSSMGAQQDRLQASFDGFIDAINNALADVVSYHVGVVTSDAYENNAAGCRALGDLVTRTGGADAAGLNCAPFAAGERFATQRDDLSVKFPCMAQVGTSGSYQELPVSATVAALDPAQAQPGACNAGFLRDDAILVVVLVTDDAPWSEVMDDAHPDADTSRWHDAVVAAKGGDEEALVVIGFVPHGDVSCTGGPSPNLSGFVASFGDQGVLASICLPDYAPVLASAIQTIGATCANFNPSG